MNDEDLRKRLDALGSEHGDYRHAVRWFVAQGPAATYGLGSRPGRTFAL